MHEDGMGIGARRKIDVKSNAEQLSELFMRCSWYRSLTSSDHDLILSSSYATSIDAGGFVAHRNVSSEYWIGVSTGLIKLAIYSMNGKGCTFSGVPPEAGLAKAVLSREN